MKFILVTCVFLVTIVNFSLACECGLEGSNGRIYKGTAARAHKYPWLAHIRSYDRSRWTGSFAQCGGSLIDEQHVITAAHCVHDEYGSVISPSNLDVFLGRVNAFSEFTDSEYVSKIWVHPKYNNQDLTNDIAILTLSKSVKFTQTVAPVCLPNSEKGLAKLTVAGWGTTSATSSSSDTLLEVDVDFMTKDECNKAKKTWFNEKVGIPSFLSSLFSPPSVADSHMCAINKKTLGDACAGDSGGPLMHKGSDGRWYLMGVVSGSWTECGTDPNTSGLYTRVNLYKSNIKSIAPNSCWKDFV